MPLEAIAGQERAAALLRASLRAGNLHHACLLTGPQGVGRTALARELAAVLLCPQGTDEACGKCPSCRAFRTGNHPDYFEIGVPEGKQSLPINAIRGDRKTGQRGIQDEASVKPLLAPRRVFLVRDVERMSIEAANCFLKTLEEPPGDARFVLVAEGLADVPETIVSRCQVMKLSGLSAAQVAERLAGEGAGAEEARWLAQRSWGSPGRARAFRERKLHEFNRALVAELCRFEIGRNFHVTDWLLKQTSESSSSAPEARLVLLDLLECAGLFYRDLAALSLDPDAAVSNEESRAELQDCASRLSLDQIIDCGERVLDAIERIGGNANTRLALDALFSEIGRICAAGGK